MYVMLMFTLLVEFGLIFWVGHRQYQQEHRYAAGESLRRQVEVDAASELHEIREEVRAMAYQFASFGVILEQFPSARDRHLRAVNSEQRRA